MPQRVTSIGVMIEYAPPKDNQGLTEVEPGIPAALPVKPFTRTESEEGATHDTKESD